VSVSVTDVAGLLELYDRLGDGAFGEEVPQTAHALQCAGHAEASGAGDVLVAAALLHDVGHLLAPPHAAGWRHDVDDDRHEALGAATLASIFGPDVAAPVALHVLAKRWRCTVDPTYASELSDASRASFVAQGGPLDESEVAHFEAHPSFADATALREWDDLAKDPDAATGSIHGYHDLLATLAGARVASRHRA
jgi:predicted HD phosphohydrolase